MLQTKPTSSALYDIKIDEKEAFCHFARVSKAPFNRFFPGYQRDISQTEEASFVSFEASDFPVKVEIRPQKSFENVVVRPLSKNILPTVSDGVITIEIGSVGQYVVEPYGLHHALHIFVNPSKDFSFVHKSENLLYFGKGVHNPGVIKLESDMTVYVDKDAVVFGAFEGAGVENVTICGYGIVDGGFFERTTENYLLAMDFRRFPDGNWEKEQMRNVRKFDETKFPKEKRDISKGYGSKVYESREQFLDFLEEFNTVKTGIHLYNCKNVTVDGIIFRDSAGLTATSAGCSDIHFNNVKTVGMWRYNSDGIDFYNCSCCSVKNSFLRNFDDCICVKGQLGWDTLPSRDITVENCVVWADWGCSLEIGVDTVADVIENVVFRDCDCIHHFNMVLAVGNGDRANVQNIVFENIRVEYSDEDTKWQMQESEDSVFVPIYTYAPLIYIHMYSGVWSDDRIDGHIRNVLFKDISVLTPDGGKFPELIMKGTDEVHCIENVTLENFTHNGEKVQITEISKNDFCKNIFTM